ncbi:MAG: thiamine-phosphate kinase [Gammaproteobacteria bacterium]
MSRDEFQTIRHFFTERTEDPDVQLGIGDDAAIVNASGPLAVATDTMVDGVHFPKGTAADIVGYRAAAINLSDMAAMGARPRWCTLALTIPDADEAWLEGFSAGFFTIARSHGMSLIGGDLTRGPLSVTLQLIGDFGGQAELTRSGGNVGDEIFVTGSLGDAAAGLALIEEGAADEGDEHRSLAARFYRPTPRVAAGRSLAQFATAAIDVSDGLLADLAHVCDASHCGAVIDVERLPLSAELLSLFPPQSAQAFALSGGDDYELCFTAPAAKARAIEDELGALGTSAHRIGELVAGAGVECLRGGIAFLPFYSGHKHF